MEQEQQLQNSNHEDIPYAEIVDVEKVMEEENIRDARQIAQDTALMREIMGDISELVEDGGEHLVVAREVTEESVETMGDVNDNLRKARKAQAKAVVLKATIYGALTGVLVGGPVGGALGYTAGATVGGVIIGGVSLGGIFGSISHSIFKHRARRDD